MNDDLISRQVAIDAVIAEGRNVDSRYLESERIIHEADAVEAISMLPSIDAVSVNHGRWEMKEDPYGFFDEIPVCSECGCTTKLRETYRFCPNCGADMRGSEE